MSKNVSIIGLGYVGLPTAAVVAEAGFNTLGVDIDQNIVEIVNSGKIHIVEPGLQNIIENLVKNNQLKA